WASRPPPVGGARANSGIGRAFVDAGEMLECGGWVVEKSQRDPASHEVVFGTVIGIARGRSFVHDAIGNRCVAEIDQPPSQPATLAPPLIPLLSAASLMLETRAVHRAGRFSAEAARWCSIAWLLQLYLSALAQQWNARPVGICTNEARVTLES